MASAKKTNTGTISVVASMRVTTRYLYGFIPETSMASICSVTFIEPNSAPIPDAILPAQIKAVITGAISLISDNATIPGNHDSAPNSARVGRDCNVSTRPIMKPVIPTSGSDLYPII